MIYDPLTGELIRNGHAVGTPDSGGYLQVWFDGKLRLAHRVAWFLYYGAWPTKHIDHIDRDKSNNRITNLREVSNAENAQNRSRASTSNTGQRGISWCAKRQAYRVRITVGGVTRRCGDFGTLDAALAARLVAERTLHTHSPVHKENACPT